jgi:hypothetical protein
LRRVVGQAVPPARQPTVPRSGRRRAPLGRACRAPAAGPWLFVLAFADQLFDGGSHIVVLFLGFDGFDENAIRKPGVFPGAKFISAMSLYLLPPMSVRDTRVIGVARTPARKSAAG